MPYIVLTHTDPEKFIPRHDPSYVHPTLEGAEAEAKHDLEAYGKDVDIWELDSTKKA